MSTHVLSFTDLRGSNVRSSTRLKRPRITPSEESVSRVRRCLFGPRSADEAFSAQEEAMAALRCNLEADMLKYNFDFVRGSPLEGDYVWIPVTVSQENTSSSPVFQQQPSTATKLRQSHITDFLRVSKSRNIAAEKQMNSSSLLNRVTSS